MRGELSLYEIQIALAASYRLAEWVSIYGGPFAYFADGDLDVEKDSPWAVWIPEGKALLLESSYDIDQTTQFGGYVGAQFDLTGRLGLGIEYQHTAGTDAVTAGLAWRF